MLVVRKIRGYFKDIESICKYYFLLGDGRFFIYINNVYCLRGYFRVDYD